jgi:hypothetical protein
VDHVVYVDAKSNELEKLIAGTKSMIIRGAMGRKLPYGRVDVGDILYFIRNNGEGLIRAKAAVASVFNSEKMEKAASVQLVEKNQGKLQLDNKQFVKWAGKRYLVLIEIDNFAEVESFQIDRSNYGNMDDWLLVDQIGNVAI